MIIDFSVTNYGPIKEKQTLSFEADKNPHLEDYYIHSVGNLRLLKLVFIYGANASGKTSILKALELLRDFFVAPLSQKDNKIDYKPFLLDSQTSKSNTIFELNFITNNIKYNYLIEFNQIYIIREVLNSCSIEKYSKFKEIVSRVTDEKSQTVNIKFKSLNIGKELLVLLQGNTLWNNSIFTGYNKTSVDIDEFKDVTTFFVKHFMGLIPSGGLSSFITNEIDDGNINKKDIISILKQADLSISDLLIEKNEEDIPVFIKNVFLNDKTISNEMKAHLRDDSKAVTYDFKFEHETGTGEKVILDSELESRGTLKYYGLAGMLSYMLSQHSSFCIDELETSLHPDLFRHFILSYLCNSTGTQCIVTTHNRDLLAEKDIFRNDAIWLTEKDESGATELYSISHFDSSVIRKNSSIFNAYKLGKFGAVPNLGNYHLDFTDYEKK